MVRFRSPMPQNVNRSQAHPFGEHTIWPEQDTPWWFLMQWPMIDENVYRRNDKNLMKGVWTSKFLRFEVADQKEEKRNLWYRFVCCATIIKSFQEAYLWAPRFPLEKANVLAYAQYRFIVSLNTAGIIWPKQMYPKKHSKWKNLLNVNLDFTNTFYYWNL